MNIPSKKTMQISQVTNSRTGRVGGGHGGFLVLTEEESGSPSGVNREESLVFENAEDLAKYVLDYFGKASDGASVRG